MQESNVKNLLMMCVLDLFRSCLLLSRHRKSHDITTESGKPSESSLKRAHSSTSVISCTKTSSDLDPIPPSIPPHLTPPRRPLSAIDPPLCQPQLPVRPASIHGMPTISEVESNTGQRVTVVENYSDPQDCYKSIEPQYSEPQDSLNMVEVHQDIYEEIKGGREDNKENKVAREEEDLPDVVTSAYASGEQVYQELLDLVKEEEIRYEEQEEKRRSQLLLMEAVPPTGNHLEGLYAVPHPNRTERPRLPPRRTKSNTTNPTDTDWAPKVPEKSNLLRRTVSDAASTNVIVENGAGQSMKQFESVSIQVAPKDDSSTDTMRSNSLYEELYVARDRLI